MRGGRQRIRARAAAERARPDVGPLPELAAGHDGGRPHRDSLVRPGIESLWKHREHGHLARGGPTRRNLCRAPAGGPNGVAASEAAAVKRLAGNARDLGEEPWQRWRAHRFDLSAERLKAFLEPAGAYLDTIELAGLWSVLPDLHARVKSAIAVGGLALCHFSHAYEQGCCAYFSFGGSGDSEDEARAAYGRGWEGAMTAA